MISPSDVQAEVDTGAYCKGSKGCRRNMWSSSWDGCCYTQALQDSELCLLGSPILLFCIDPAVPLQGVLPMAVHKAL